MRPLAEKKHRAETADEPPSPAICKLGCDQMISVQNAVSSAVVFSAAVSCVHEEQSQARLSDAELNRVDSRCLVAAIRPPAAVHGHLLSWPTKPTTSELGVSVFTSAIALAAILNLCAGELGGWDEELARQEAL